MTSKKVFLGLWHRSRANQKPRAARAFCHAPSWIVLALLICGAAASSSVPARAQSDAQHAPYKELIDQALAEFKRQNWPEARVLFRRAHALDPNARTLRGMGIVSFEMRDYVQAVRDLSAALGERRQALTGEQEREARTLLERARTFVAAYALRVDPAEAVVKIDGARPALEPDGTVLLAFGQHIATATLDGYEDARVELRVQGGESGEVALVLTKQAEVASSPSGTVEAPSRETAPALAPSTARIEEPSRGRLRYTWVALGATALFGGSTVAAWFLGANELDSLDQKCERAATSERPCTRDNVNTDSVKRYELITNIGIGLTGAMLATTVVLGAIEWPRARDRRVEARVGFTSLLVRGAF